MDIRKCCNVLMLQMLQIILEVKGLIKYSVFWTSHFLHVPLELFACVAYLPGFDPCLPVSVRFCTLPLRPILCCLACRGRDRMNWPK